MKLWVFYNNDDICGWTLSKDIKHQYSLERPNCHYKKYCMSELKYKKLHSLYSQYELFKNVMDDGNDVIYPITSYKENDQLDYLLSSLEYKIEELYKEISKYPIKKKYKKIINDALCNYYTKDDSGLISNFDITSIYIKKISTYFNNKDV